MISLLAAGTSPGRAVSRTPAEENRLADPDALAPALALQESTPATPSAGPVVIELTALSDTVVAHETAWIELRVTNNTARPLTIPFRSNKIAAEWRFTAPDGHVLVDWPEEEEMEDAPLLKLGPGETFYEVLSPESSYGILTSPGTVLGHCRVGRYQATSPATVSRRPALPSERSALKALGPQHLSSAREKAKLELWSLCGAGGEDYFDCDEALFTVAWDRMLVAPNDAMAIVDSLIARDPGSGWCRPALFGLMSNLPEGAGRRYLDGIVAASRGGVAGAYAAELLRRAGHRQFPSNGRK
jgi:hypothetical protein